MNEVLETLNTQLEDKRLQLETLLNSGKDIINDESYSLECEALTSEIDSLISLIGKTLL